MSNPHSSLWSWFWCHFLGETSSDPQLGQVPHPQIVVPTLHFPFHNTQHYYCHILLNGLFPSLDVGLMHEGQDYGAKITAGYPTPGTWPSTESAGNTQSRKNKRRSGAPKRDGIYQGHISPLLPLPEPPSLPPLFTSFFALKLNSSKILAQRLLSERNDGQVRKFLSSDLKYQFPQRGCDACVHYTDELPCFKR